jgi:hypothetical protein
VARQRQVQQRPGSGKREQHRAKAITSPNRAAGTAARQQKPAEREPDRPRRKVDEEDQTPPSKREQHPADRWPKRQP